jgi:hypothetical protein
LPLRLEEAAQQSCGGGFADAANDYRTVVAGGRGEYSGAVIDSAALWVIRAEDQPADAEQADGVGAHRAGFQGDDQVAIGQAWTPAQGSGGPQSQDLGMRGRIVARLRAVSGPREDTAIRANHHGAHRDFPARGSGFGFGQGFVHRVSGHPCVIAGCLPRGGLV